MSNVTYNAQACADNVENIGQNTCITKKMLALSVYAFLGSNRKVTIENLQDEEFINTEMAAKRLFKFPMFSSVLNIEQSEVETNTNNYGNINTISTKAAFNATFGVDAGTCTFRKLQQWTDKQLTLFFVDDTRFAGVLNSVAEVLYLKGINGKISVRDGIKFKTELNDENIYPIELNVQSPNANIDEFVTTSYNPAEKTGVTDAIVSMVSEDGDEVTVSVLTACDGLAVVGLLEADFTVLDGSGAAVTITGFVDNADGTYTLTSAFDGEASVELDSVVEVGGFLYESVSAVAVEFGA